MRGHGALLPFRDGRWQAFDRGLDLGALTSEGVGSLGMARCQPAATKLRDGRVLVTGGTGGTAPTANAELIAVGTIR